MAAAPVPPIAEIKQRARASWMAGDFGQIAKLNEPWGEDFVSRLGLKPAMKVLDLGCGTGNQSIPAARLGATVTGLDLAPNLLAQAHDRAQKENLQVEWIEGDAEQLPQADRTFDVVMSMFGAMFAPRPDLVASEMLRVCKHGGLIAMGNWIPDSFVGQMFKLTARHVPPPPTMPAPVLWGDECTVKQRLGHKASVTTTRREMDFDYPFPPAEVVEFFKQYFGPTQMAFRNLDEAGQRALTEDLVKHWSDHNRGGDERTLHTVEYLEVHARVN